MSVEMDGMSTVEWSRRGADVYEVLRDGHPVDPRHERQLRRVCEVLVIGFDRCRDDLRGGRRPLLKLE